MRRIEANALQFSLIQFFAQSTPDRYAGLTELLHRIRDEVTFKDIRTLPLPDQEILETGIRRVFSLPIETDDGNIIHPGWAGGGTVVLLNSYGAISAAWHHPAGRVYDVYASDLAGYALAKAVLELHLAREGRRGVIGNRRHLIDKGVPERLISIGSWISVNPMGSIGVSGAEAGPAYTEPFAPGMMPTSDLAAANLAAGAADLTFASALAQYFSERSPARTCFKEPAIVNVGRLLH